MNPTTSSSSSVTKLSKLINSTPLPSLPTLLRRQLPFLASSPSHVPALLSHLHLSHSSVLKLLSIFLFSLTSPNYPHPPSPLSFHPLLLSLSRSRRSLPLALPLLSLLSAGPHARLLLTPHSLALLLAPHARLNPYPSTLSFFSRCRSIWASAGLPFNSDHFTALIRAFSSRARMPEARAAFNLYHSTFPPTPKTLNTLLLGFKEAGDLLAFELFYNEMLARGFSPDVVTYNIRIDAYCKRNRFLRAEEVFKEMETEGFSPTVQTVTTLIHGAGIKRNVVRARQMFDEMGERGLVADKGAYNALMGALTRVGDMKGGMELMDEMERHNIEVDDVGYYTLFCGFRKGDDLEGVCGVYNRMVAREYVPRVRTVMLLMKFFCERRRRLDLGLELWGYLVEKGCCPHRHALDLLVVGLCGDKRVGEAYDCFKQVVERERWPSERSFKVLEGALAKRKEAEKLVELKKMIERLDSLRSPHSMAEGDNLEEILNAGKGVADLLDLLNAGGTVDELQG